MKDLWMELQTVANCFHRVISRISLFHYGDLSDDHLYISTFISGAVWVFESLEIQFSMCESPKSACVILFSPFTSYGSPLDMG